MEAVSEVRPMMGIGTDFGQMNRYGYGGYNPGQAAGAAAANASESEKSGAVKNPGESEVKEAGRRSSPAKCETCKNRKYQDGSDENVSFKTAQKMSPASAASRVRAHEQEHVSNAYAEAAQKGGQVLRASVQIHTAICPECGRTYVSGGTTTSQIKYPNEENPYMKARKQADSELLPGMNMDEAV
jgi:hypothetical protein